MYKYYVLTPHFLYKYYVLTPHFLKCGSGLKFNVCRKRFSRLWVTIVEKFIEHYDRCVVPREISVVQQPSNGFFREENAEKAEFSRLISLFLAARYCEFAVLGIRTYQLRYQLSAVRALCFLTRIPLDNQIAFNNGWPTFFLFHVHPCDAILVNHIPEPLIPATPSII